MSVCVYVYVSTVVPILDIKIFILHFSDFDVAVPVLSLPFTASNKNAFYRAIIGFPLRVMLRWIADTFGSGHKQGQSEHRDGGAVTNIGEVPVHFVTP